MGAYQLAVQIGVQSEPPLPPPPPPPTIAADRYEANDVFTVATNLGKLNSQTQTGLTTHTATDADWFRFSVNKSGVFSISVLFASAGGNLDITVCDSKQNVLAWGASTGDNESTKLSLSAGGQYYIKVFSPTGALNTYDLAIAKLANSAGGLAVDEGHGTPVVGAGEHDHDHDHQLDAGDFDLLASDVGRAFHAARGMTFGSNVVTPRAVVRCPSSVDPVMDEATPWLDRLAADLAENRIARTTPAFVRLAANKKACRGHFDARFAAWDADSAVVHDLVLRR